MNCYYSPDTPAVGICKSCGKGLSREYATDVGNGLACKDACEERVKLINRILDNNSRVLSTSNIQLRRNSVFACVVGLLFVLLGGLMGALRAEPIGVVFSLLGAVFILRGIFGYTRMARYPTIEKEAQQTHRIRGDNAGL